MLYNGYEAIIGIEIHVELKTESKVFCSCSAKFGSEPNINCCPVCVGMPGTLPRLNKKAVEYIVTAGLATGCGINRLSWFDRKNYFYPDLPKGYQITQKEKPFCVGGRIELHNLGYEKSVGITEIHLEEDAGKLSHTENGTLIDYNRCGVPLIEIVSDPDMRTPEEAKAYVEEIRQTMLFMGISDVKMNEGSLRCDVNVSVHRPDEEYGTRCEIKNINSINYVGKAVEYEIKRQIEILSDGGAVGMETRRFNENTMQTETMRKKESIDDYRYFTEPNIPPVELSEEFISQIRENMPLMPAEARKKAAESADISDSAVEMLVSGPEIFNYYMRACEMTSGKARTRLANLIVSSVIPKLTESDENADIGMYISCESISAIAEMFSDNRISSASAKKLVEMVHDTRLSPDEIAERESMYLITDAGILSDLSRQAIEMNPKAVADYLKGKESAKKAVLGAVHRLSRGRAEPETAQRIIDELLEKLRK